MSASLLVEQITEPLAEHGEGPVYWGEQLYWVDLLVGDVLRLSAGGQVERIHVADVAAALRPRVGGGLVLATERGFAVYDEPLRPEALVPAVQVPAWVDPAVRMNDGGCDPQGRFYCGSVRYDGAARGGALYRLNGDLTVTRVLDHVTVSNGLAWTPDGCIAYYVDSALNTIDVLRIEGGEFMDRRVLVRFDETDGTPDGLCLDSEGHIWIAMYGAGVVHRYSPGGRRIASVALPVRNVTACTFGGPGLDTLYVTTSRLGQPVDAEPAAGAVFAVRPGVTGIAAMPFRT